MPDLWPQLRSVTRPQEGLALLELDLSGQLRWFDGHFPNQPLLPAVVQTHWAIGYARSQLGVTRVFRSLHNLKFSRVIRPLATLQLHLTWQESRCQLGFVYMEAGITCSSGRVQFI
jgi:3-hydroxymyristoyl/3-hydroxydecanoyl-(acyl carrier protein) dehydratase